MKKFLKNCTKVFLMLVITCVILSKPSQADVGYFSSYDSGGSSSSWDSSDWSSSSWDSGGASSSSSSGGTSTSILSNLSSEQARTIGLIGILITMAIILYIVHKTECVSDNYDSISVNKTLTDNTDIVESQIREIDQMFSAEKFMQWSKDVFIKLQTAWMERKWENIRLLESNELFQQHSMQLQQLIDTNRINIVDKISVTHTHLNSFRQDGDKEILEMTLKAVMRDYIIDADTKKVLVGNVNQDVYMIYTLTFMRKAGMKTKEFIDEKSITNCPNCGAVTKITSSGKCEYCRSIITTGEHDWVLSNLEGKRGR